MQLDYEDANVDLAMIIPKQRGLDFDIILTLQDGNELHILTPHIWCKFFPAHLPHIAENFRNAATGLLSGEYRILQFIRNQNVCKAYLQKPEADDWITLYKHHSKFCLPWMKMEKRVVRNGSSGMKASVIQL